MIWQQRNSYAGCAKVIQQMLGVQISTEYIHQVVQAYQERIDAWRKRQLKSFYPFLFIDCLYVSMRDENGIVSKGQCM